MDVPYLTPEAIRKVGISAGVYTFAFASFFFLSDVSTASSLGVIISAIAAAVAMNILSLEFDRFDVLITSGSMAPLFLVLEYLAFVGVYSPLGVLISALKDVLLYAGFSLITATLVLYRMKPEARMRLEEEKEKRRPKKEEVFYVPEAEKEPAGGKKPDVSLIKGTGEDKLAALEKLGKEFEGSGKKEGKKLPPELEKAAFRIHGLIVKGKGKKEVLEVLERAGFSKKEAERIYEYSLGL